VYAELRVYMVKPGAMDAWVAEWLEHIYPLRLRLGFGIPEAWIAGEDRFVWVLTHDGEDYEAANEAYYASPERRAVHPEPSRHLRGTEHWPLTAVLPPIARDS
jgi:hypothetical protein